MVRARKKTTSKAAKCACPFCDEVMEASLLPFCQACGIAIQYCVECETPAPKNAKVCPNCGGKLISK
ncbi:MAG: zinc ribbon domain-containing protein [Dehalococcoidia bacterium]|nr:zinc ribbon domain-containing protein [Dehalococcoidia bacterium]